MWFLNYCAPFIYDTSGGSQSIRFALYVILLVQFIIYLVFIVYYKVCGGRFGAT